MSEIPNLGKISHPADLNNSYAKLYMSKWEKELIDIPSDLQKLHQVMNISENICVCCGIEGETTDELIPCGNENTPGRFNKYNCVTMCKRCNISKNKIYGEDLIFWIHYGIKKKFNNLSIKQLNEILVHFDIKISNDKSKKVDKLSKLYQYLKCSENYNSNSKYLSKYGINSYVIESNRNTIILYINKNKKYISTNNIFHILNIKSKKLENEEYINQNIKVIHKKPNRRNSLDANFRYPFN